MDSDIEEDLTSDLLDPLLDDSSQPSPPDPSVSGHCYCGGERDLSAAEFLCLRCRKWFHGRCCQLPTLPRMRFQTNYAFLCRTCNAGQESFARRQSNFAQMCETVLANLTADGDPHVAFSGRQVISYLEQNWDHVTTLPRRVKQTWHNTVLKTMQKESELFVCDQTEAVDPLFALRNQDLTRIAPNCAVAIGAKTGKRRPEELAKRQKSELSIPRLPSSGFPTEYPFNKDGYRYVLAEADPHGPFRHEFEESQDLAGKPIPGWLCRKLMPERVLLSLHDRAPQLKVSEDRKTVTGDKGYCMVRANLGAARGRWFYEVSIDELPEGAAVRLGWAQELANLQAPLGYDVFGYSVRSRKGTKFHESRGRHFADKGFARGDTLGFSIALPESGPRLPPTFKDRPLVKFKSFLYFEQKDDLQSAQKALKPLEGASVDVWRNGRFLGTAFTDIFGGQYFPAASLYKNACVTFNFGPDFAFAPHVTCRPVSDLVVEAQVAQALSDALYLVENEGNLRLDTFYGQ